MIASAGSTYVPYVKTSYFDHAFPYEGMETLETPVASNMATAPVVSGNTAPSTGVFGSSMNLMCKMMSSTPPATTPVVTKVEGFALQPSPYSASDMIDRYGKTPSESGCFGKSMGYSRSTGPLCFSDEDLKLLTTRGGNMSGRDSVIGQDPVK